MKIPDYCLGFYNLSSILHAKFDHLMSRIRQKSKKESCSFMSLEYACKNSARLVKYNVIYGGFSPDCSILYSLSCVNYFM